jgi:carboxylesterase type B
VALSHTHSRLSWLNSPSDGGAWILGSNDEFGLYDGTDLAAEYGVVIVAANYRLDTLGWMALDELAAESPTGSYGNYGLIDQGFALEWSQRNIRAFGGDPNKVTIFGESAGGYSVCQHITRPESNGLFSSAIMESGGCDGPWLIFDGEDSKAWGNYYAEKVGCPVTASGADRLTCLRKKSVDAILEPYASWFCPVKRPDDPWCNRTSGAPIDAMRGGGGGAAGGVGSWPSPRPPMAPIVGWAATVDGTSLGLPETPYQAMLKGKINKSPTGENISVIFGTNANEMALFIAASFLVFPGAHIPVAKGDIRLAAEHLLAYHRPSWNESDVDRVLAAYNTGDLAGAHPAYILTAMGTDFSFACNTHQAAAALQAAGVNAYVYLFDFKFPGYIDPKSELCQLGSEVLCGVAHGCEVEYVFQHSNLGANEKAVSSSMGAWWTNMAKYGNPNGQGAEVWTTYSAGTPSIMHINEKPAVSTTPAADSRCEVWNALPAA